MWQQLVETALLGTEKKSLDLEILPQDIRDFIINRHHHDPELKFLEAVSLSYYYREAGKMPEVFTGTWNEEVIQETKETAPKTLLDVFSKIESVDYQLRENLFYQWLSVITGRENIVTPEFIPRILNMGNTMSFQTKSKIIDAVGKKGAWVLSHSRELNFKQSSIAHENLWLEGNSQDRKNLFSSKRKVSPSEAITMLRSTWSEESVVNKKAFLEIIKESPDPADYSFLADLYESEFKFQPKEKKTEKECRKIIASILVRDRESGLYKTTAEKLSSYFSKAKKGLVGFVTGKEQISFTLPKEDDTFWNSQTMSEVYGFETKNIDIAIYNYPSQYWLALFFEMIPMQFWLQFFDGNYSRMLACFLDSDSFKTKINGSLVSIYQPAFIEYAKYYHDADLSQWLIQHLQSQDVMSLLPFLRADDFELYVKNNKYYGDVEVLLRWPAHQERSWSLPFSLQVVARAYEMAVQNTASPMLGKVMAYYVHRDVHNNLIQYHDKARDSNNFAFWTKNIFEPVHSAIEIRTIIDSFKK